MDHIAGGGTDCDDEDASKVAPEDCPEPDSDDPDGDGSSDVDGETSGGKSTSGPLGCNTSGHQTPLWPAALFGFVLTAFIRTREPIHAPVPSRSDLRLF